MKNKMMTKAAVIIMCLLSNAILATPNMIKVQLSIEGERQQWEVLDNGIYYGIESLDGGDPKPFIKDYYISPSDAGHQYTLKWVWGEWVTPPPYFPESTWYKFSVKVLEKPDDVYFVPSSDNSPMDGTLLFRINQYGLTNGPPDTSQIRWNFTISAPSIAIIDGVKASDAGDPINLESGANHFNQKDITINCPFENLNFKRTLGCQH